MKIGLVVCASMLDQVRKIIKVIPKEQFAIYPVLPRCLFKISGDTIHRQIDKSVLGNEATIIIYGSCHVALDGLLDMYCDNNLVKIEGDNCWEMLLGAASFDRYTRDGCWLSNKPFMTKWRKEVAASFGFGTRNGALVSDCGIKKLLVFRFEDSQPEEELVKELSQEVGVPYIIKDRKIGRLKDLVQSAVTQACVENEARCGSGLQLPVEMVPLSLIKSMNEAIYIIDKQGKKTTFISPIIEKLLNISTQGFRQTFLSTRNQGYYLSKDQHRIVAKRFAFITDCLQRGFDKPLELEYQILNSNGERQWIREVLSPWFKADGSIGAFTGKIEDITRRKKDECLLKTLYQKETESRCELESQIQDRIEFTRALVHELKTPLTPIIAASDVLTLNLKKEPWMKLARNINNGACRLNKRVNELLNLSHGEINSPQIKKIPLDCIKLTTDIIQYIDARVQKANQFLSFAHDEESIFIEADPDRLRQILLNLLDNAIKYTPKRGFIKLKCYRTSADMVFQVINSGNEISSTDKLFLFEPYYKLKKDMHRLDGLGLGLALSKKFVELHGGKIWVESGGGKVMHLYLPYPYCP